MRSDLETFLGTLFQLLRELQASLGEMAWVVLGVFLPAGIVLGVIVIRWILHGGLGRGPRFFFNDRRLIEHYLKER